MAKNVMEVELPVPYTWEATGEEISSAVIRMLKVGEQMELAKKFPNRSKIGELMVETMRRRLVRLGSFEAPVDMALIEEMPAPDFDYLVDAAEALDRGFESVEEYRASDQYQGG